jgi:ubiquinone/menaquinone biosynthesis C-methylase UbiE
MIVSTKEKYNRIAPNYDFLKTGDMLRWSAAQRSFFKSMRGRILYVGAGTGQEIVNFPPGLDILAIDLSRNMLERARPRAARYRGKIKFAVMDIENLGFPDNVFDTILSVCVFCTVEHPVRGLQELKRVLKPGGRIMMFEHVLSKNPVYGTLLKLMSLLTTRVSGTHLDRDTAENLRLAGFALESERNIYLDIVKTFVGHRR